MYSSRYKLFDFDKKINDQTNETQNLPWAESEEHWNFLVGSKHALVRNTGNKRSESIHFSTTERTFRILNTLKPEHFI